MIANVMLCERLWKALGPVNTHLLDVGAGPKKCEENMPFIPLSPASLLGCWISLAKAIERR